MLETIKTFYVYNSWAMEQLLKPLGTLTEAEFTAPDCSGHGSIRQTLAHLIITQWGWFSWFDKSMQPEEVTKLELTGEQINTNEKLREKWNAVDKQTRDCVEKQTEESLKEIWSTTLPSGYSLSMPFWKLLMHVANHGTHTRAQIVAAIRRLGHEPGNLDFLRFAEGKK
jgi:uncharacterized damage-inducible protein DinB